MQKPDHHKPTTEPVERADQVHQPDPSTTPSPTATKGHGFDWFAIGMVVLISAFFALAVRLNTQPPASLTPAAVLSATGCGLLITALRKLHTMQRPGLPEAALGGFILALSQFVAALTYPAVLSTLFTDQNNRLGFLTTWGLIAIFSILFSIIGAALGHLAFAPLRPLPSKPAQAPNDEIVEAPLATSHETTEPGEDAEEQLSSPPLSEEQEALAETPLDVASPPPQRSLASYLITILLLGLAPVVAAFVFSAAYDFVLGLYRFTPGPFPSLRVLSTMLPWQVPIHIGLNGANAGSLILLLWRIPLFLGNPTIFDVQALEPYIFNGAALSLLLLTIPAQEEGQSRQSSLLSWQSYLFLAFALGFFLALPSDLWIMRGLQGLLQIGNFAVPLRTLHLLDSVTFTLDLVTGPLICLAIALLLRARSRK